MLLVSLFPSGTGKKYSSGQTTFRKLWKLLKKQSSSAQYKINFSKIRVGESLELCTFSYAQDDNTVGIEFMEHCSCFRNCDEDFDIYQYIFMVILGGNCDFSISGDEDDATQLRNVPLVTSHISKQQSILHSILITINPHHLVTPQAGCQANQEPKFSP